ncbi:short-chain dehydrogenase/reductase 3 [Octopus sinensis]|uniref:Short-chain dehydrogenase/reductase 3 n=1 Tax=Octopus sinensis TaxID=2607531 RepID=A0A6P7TCI0_9MOLL|nr:short-chain dehydrogenase/reductase 3 [Octopus sinensis]
MLQFILLAGTTAINVAYFIIGSWYLTVKVIFILFRRALLPTSLKAIENDIILITGGGRGLGRQIALEFAKYKPKLIILWGRHVQSLSQTSTEVCALGTPCVYMQCDVSIKEDIDKQANEIKRQHGAVTILVNNAGLLAPGNFLEVEDEKIEQVFKVNILAHFRTVKTFLPEMQQLEHGHIVTIGSCLGISGMDGVSSYSSSKFGVTSFADSLAAMLDSATYKGVESTAVYPFQISNSMFAGCEIRFPRLFPPVDEKYVAVKTVEAVLTNTKSLMIPRLIGYVIILKTLMPFEVTTKLNKFFGVSTAMEKCKKLGNSTSS